MLMKKISCRRGMSTMEFAVLAVCLVAGLIAMQGYIARGMQGRFRQSADSIGEQYAPGRTTSDTTQNFISSSTTITNTTDENGLTNSTTISNSTDQQRRAGWETVGPLE